jgi:hypothetical protein
MRTKRKNASPEATTLSSFARDSICFSVLLFLMFGLGIHWRLDGLSSRGLEYDEFWTLTHYVPLSVSSILSSLATPNNHPLNSLLMKWCVELFGPTPLAMRIPAVAAGILLFIPAGLPAWRLSGLKSVGLLAVALVVCNGAFIHFSQTARGYSIQLLLLTFLLALIVHHIVSGKDSFQVCGGIIVVSGFAIFALPTSILYIFPMTLAHLGILAGAAFRKSEAFEAADGRKIRRLAEILKRFVEKRRMMLSAYVALTVCLAFWYAGNYSDFKSGQGQFSDIGSFRNWLFFIGTVCSRISHPIIWLAAALPLFFRGWRWLTAVAAAAILFPFIMIPFTKAGPVRVYIPVFIHLAISASVGMALLLDKAFGKNPKTRFSALFVILALLAIDGAKEKASWTPLDWRVAVKGLREEFGRGYCLVYPPNSGYAILANFGGEALLETFARLPKGEKDESLVLVDSRGLLRGLN